MVVTCSSKLICQSDGRGEAPTAVALRNRSSDRTINVFARAFTSGSSCNAAGRHPLTKCTKYTNDVLSHGPLRMHGDCQPRLCRTCPLMCNCNAGDTSMDTCTLHFIRVRWLGRPPSCSSRALHQSLPAARRSPAVLAMLRLPPTAVARLHTGHMLQQPGPSPPGAPTPLTPSQAAWVHPHNEPFANYLDTFLPDQQA